MAAKDFRFEFYRLVMPDNSVSVFSELINQVSQIPLKDRIRSIFDRPIYLYETRQKILKIPLPNNKVKKITLIEGMMIRVKVDDLPDWVNTEGDLQPLEDDDQKLGLGEKSVFLYNPETRIFIFQKTQSGASFGAPRKIEFLQMDPEDEAFK